MVPFDREFLSQAIIVISMCLGGWLMLVKPSADELRQLEARIDANRAQSNEVDFNAFQQAAARAPMIRARCAEIEQRGALAKDSATLYGRIKELARANEIEVKSLRPGVERSDDGREDRMSVTRVDMTAEGEFEQVAGFLGALHDLGAYLRPVSVQFAPSKRPGGSGMVMQLGLEAVRFTLPKALDALEGKS